MKKLLLVACCISGLALVPAQAHLTDLGLFELDGVLNGTSAEADWIESVTSSGDLTYLEKWDYGQGFNGEGAAPNSGPANYTVAPEDAGPNATVTWDLSGTVYEAAYVLVKDGVVNQKHLYRLYEVSTDQVVAGGPDPVTINNDKDISHIAWYGVRAPGTGVPDGGATAVLLGLGMLGLGFMARRKA